MEREIVEEVAQRLVDPTTKRVYTTGMIKKGLDVLTKQGGHTPQQDSLQHKLGKLNMGENGRSGQPTPKGSSETSGQATPMTDEDAGSEKGKSRAQRHADVDWCCDNEIHEDASVGGYESAHCMAAYPGHESSHEAPCNVSDEHIEASS